LLIVADAACRLVVGLGDGAWRLVDESCDEEEVMEREIGRCVAAPRARRRRAAWSRGVLFPDGGVKATLWP
jgi:hypothetical protein